MQRIVIDLYDRGPDQTEAEEFAQDIRDTFSPSGDVRVERVIEERVAPFGATQIRARQKVWNASQRGVAVSLTAEETDALWQSILNDAIAARAFTGPRPTLTHAERLDRAANG